VVPHKADPGVCAPYLHSSNTKNGKNDEQYLASVHKKLWQGSIFLALFLRQITTYGCHFLINQQNDDCEKGLEGIQQIFSAQYADFCCCTLTAVIGKDHF
jgi:hypothetical protein